MKIPEDLPDDFEELISELNDVDGFSSSVLINDAELFKLLETKGLAKMNARRSHYGTKLLNYMLTVAAGDIEVIINHLK